MIGERNDVGRQRDAALVLLFCGGLLGMTTSCSLTKFSEARLETVQRSPQWRDGKFHNTLARQDGPFHKILGKWMRSSGHTVPKTDLPVFVRRGADFAEPSPSGLRVTWLGHSTALIEIDGYRVLTDPVWSARVSPISGVGPKRFFAPPLPLQELPSLDAVVISHDHFDHLDESTIVALKAHVPLFVVPLGVGAYLEEWGVELARIAEVDWWGEVKLGELTLCATPARHFSGRFVTSLYSDDTLWAGWSIASSQHRVYYSGDTAMFPGLDEIGERLGPFDVTLIESGAYDALWPDVHLGPEQAVEAHRMVRGKLMMPVHWGTFNLANHSWVEPAERVWQACRRTDILLAIARPGESIDPASPPAVERWWPQVPWQNDDEAPILSTGLQETELGQ